MDSRPFSPDPCGQVQGKGGKGRLFGMKKVLIMEIIGNALRKGRNDTFTI